MPHVADDADDPDGCRSFQGWYPQLSADDVPATERVEGEVFVDDDNAFAVEPIVVVEEAAGAQRDAHDPQVVGRDGRRERHRRLLGG